ncbi:MAG TPA: hypothetical protein VKE22_08555 [Haliangiales bacterium]|nr:hypothetical protein [Haliangiales bacterium]
MNAFLRRVFGFKAGEERALVASFLCFFFLMFGYYLLRPFRDALGLGRGTEKLPWYFTATFGGICVAVPIYSALAARFPRHRLIAIAYRFFAANLVLFWAGFALGAQSLLAPVFFVWVSVYNLFVVSLFWSFMADVWSTVDAKRLFGAVAAGGSAGAILGPTVTALLAKPIGPPQLLLISAVTLEISVQCARRLGAPPSKAVGGGILAGFINVARSPYLLGIGAQILCFAVTSTVLYTQQAAYVAQAFPDTAARTTLFARLDVAINVTALAIQLFLTGRFMRAAGLTAALALLPLLTMAGFLVMGAVPSVILLVGLQALRRALHFAVDRPAREVLFTLVPREDKYKAKSFLDTFVYRGADVVGIWAYTGIASFGTSLGATSLWAAPIAAVWLAVAITVGRGAEKKGALPA